MNVVVDMFPGGDLVDGLNTHRRARASTHRERVSVLSCAFREAFGRVPNAQLARLAKQMMSAVTHAGCLL